MNNRLLNAIDGLSKRKKIFISVMILIMMIYLIFMKIQNRKCKDRHTPIKYNTKWINEGFGYGYGTMNPNDGLNDLVKEYGKPDILNLESGGKAVWKDDFRVFPFTRIEIHDEEIPEDEPVTHTNFIYAWYKMDLSKSKMVNLNKISANIKYDQSKKMVIIRSSDMKSIISILWIVKQYADNNLTLDQAVGMYGPMIMELQSDDSNGSKYHKLTMDLSQ